MLKSIIDNSQFLEHRILEGAKLEDREKYLIDIIYYLHKIIFRVLPAPGAIVMRCVESLENNGIN